MGSGKSRIAPLVANALKRRLFDTDKIIEYRMAKSVNEIFEEQGEAAFRQMELFLLRELMTTEPAVISLGGGTIIQNMVQKIVRESGVTVYLRSEPQSIFERVKHRDRRPLLRTERNVDFDRVLMHKINTLMAERKDIYERAEIIIDRDGLEPEAIADFIIQSLHEI